MIGNIDSAYNLKKKKRKNDNNNKVNLPQQHISGYNQYPLNI